jgi:hypothetical protein
MASISTSAVRSPDKPLPPNMSVAAHHKSFISSLCLSLAVDINDNIIAMGTPLPRQTKLLLPVDVGLVRRTQAFRPTLWGACTGTRVRRSSGACLQLTISLSCSNTFLFYLNYKIECWTLIMTANTKCITCMSTPPPPMLVAYGE